ncbi:MAG: hypothetical protein P4L74_01740 [Candidatus Doudnabacteria bacterium]|nr:hypothetical protein [Candidatus Doudnabacteria bacterium]
MNGTHAKGFSLRYLNISALVVLIVGVFLAYPFFVFADAQLGDGCTFNTDCATGLFCDKTNGNTCETVTNTTPCSTSADCGTSKSGLVCNSGKCGLPANNNSSQYAIGSPKGGGSCGTTDPNIIKQIQGIVQGVDSNVTYSGTCDSETIKGIQLWQQSHNLTNDGIVGSDTATAMGISLTGASTNGTGQTQGNCAAGLVSVNGLCLPPNSSACNGGICASNSLTDLLTKIITLLLALAGVIAVLMLIVGGFWYITSAGNEEQSEKGKKAIVNSIIGVIVVLLSYAIITVISSVITKGQ